MNAAEEKWLRSIQAIARDVGALLIINDIQMGCGRTGEFLSFERASLSPDIVVLSNSLSGCGFSMSLLLIRDGLEDAWQSGERTGPFQRNDLAFVSATAAINIYWRSGSFSRGIQRLGKLMRRRLEAIASEHGSNLAVRGRGMALGF